MMRSLSAERTGGEGEGEEGEGEEWGEKRRGRGRRAKGGKRGSTKKEIPLPPYFPPFITLIHRYQKPLWRKALNVHNNEMRVSFIIHHSSFFFLSP